MFLTPIRKNFVTSSSNLCCQHLHPNILQEHEKEILIHISHFLNTWPRHPRVTQNSVAYFHCTRKPRWICTTVNSVRPASKHSRTQAYTEHMELVGVVFGRCLVRISSTILFFAVFPSPSRQIGHVHFFPNNYSYIRRYLLKASLNNQRIKMNRKNTRRLRLVTKQHAVYVWRETIKAVTIQSSRTGVCMSIYSHTDTWLNQASLSGISI
jgi:hypothetical protein